MVSLSALIVSLSALMVSLSNHEASAACTVFSV
jgi:hypothetical protein